MRNYWYYGLQLHTDLPVVGLPRWLEAEGKPDIVLRLGPVPKRLAAPVWSNQLFSVDGDGAVLARYFGIFRLLASPGGREAHC